MKVLLSSESYWPNLDGGAVFERRLVHQLIEDGYEVCVVVPGNRYRSYIEHDGQSLIYRTASVPLLMNRDGYRISYYARSQVKRALDEFKPDIIHVNTMALTGMSLVRHAKKRDITMVATNHLMPENVLMSLPFGLNNNKFVHGLFWRLLVRFHQQFELVSSPTESAIKLLGDNGLTRPTRAISNGVDTKIYSPRTTKTYVEDAKLLQRFDLDSKRYVIYLGRVNAEKRLDMLIDSFALVVKQDASLQLVIAGKGNRLDELKRHAKRLKLDNQIVFTGLVTDAEKVALLRYGLMYAITSPAELQSIATMEAMACGLPVVAVDIVALKELCHDGKNGYLVTLDDRQQLANAIIKIAEDKTKQEQFSRYSRKFIETTHSHDTIYQEFYQFYSDAIHAKQ